MSQDQLSIKEHKQNISSLLFDTLETIEGVISTTIVGSFNDRDELLVISDIDTIVIVKKLDKAIFDHCVTAIASLSGEAFGFPEREVFVNSTFGPLKFDTDSNIVVHLMIYDLVGHRNHVIKSPFTCYDWERSQMRRGPSLSELYPVQKLQPSDFTGMRRGVQNYLDDLGRGSISYRKYSFKDDEVKEITLNHKLDDRHQGEFAFHIVKNLVINYCKLIEQKNLCFNDQELEQAWYKHLPLCRDFVSFFKEIRVIKLKRELQFPSHTVAKVKEFISTFSNQLQSDWAESLEMDWVRHGKTEFNDGSFLGQGRDPGLLDTPEKLECDYNRVYCSPLKRASQTALGLAPRHQPTLADELKEINYGEAEGLNYKELQIQFSGLVSAWNDGLDHKFPGGENTEDVLSRLTQFLEQAKYEKGKVLVVSHNVVIRCLLGYLFCIDKPLWFKIPVSHLECLKVRISRGRFYLDLSKDQKANIFDALVSWQK